MVALVVAFKSLPLTQALPRRAVPLPSGIPRAGDFRLALAHLVLGQLDGLLLEFLDSGQPVAQRLETLVAAFHPSSPSAFRRGRGENTRPLYGEFSRHRLLVLDEGFQPVLDPLNPLGVCLQIRLERRLVTLARELVLQARLVRLDAAAWALSAFAASGSLRPT